jgi:proteasome lid subunit RPN8/RPN11
MHLNETSVSKSNLRDVGQVIPSEWPSSTFPTTTTPRGSGFQVVCRRSVLEAIRQHGDEKPDVEVCGVMVGNVFHDAAGPFVYVQACIRGEHAESRSAQVTFKAETWIYIHERMEQYSGQRIVGWYHTHPDFGIFLSAADLYIHENFFNLVWQIAYVLDPIRSEDGMFLWRGGKAHNDSFLIEEDVPAVLKRVSPKQTPIIAQSHESQTLEQRIRRLERRQFLYGLLLLLVAVLALVWIDIRPTILHWLGVLIADSPHQTGSVETEK